MMKEEEWVMVRSAEMAQLHNSERVCSRSSQVVETR